MYVCKEGGIIPTTLSCFEIYMAQIQFINRRHNVLRAMSYLPFQLGPQYHSGSCSGSAGPYKSLHQMRVCTSASFQCNEPTSYVSSWIAENPSISQCQNSSSVEPHCLGLKLICRCLVELLWIQPFPPHPLD